MALLQEHLNIGEHGESEVQLHRINFKISGGAALMPGGNIMGSRHQVPSSLYQP